MVSRKLLQMALAALHPRATPAFIEAAADALREALAAPEPEPVAIADGTFNCDAALGTLLYAAPPAAPDHFRDVAEKVAPAQPVVREPLPEPVQRLLRFAGKKRSEVSNPCLTAREAIVIADWMQAHGITGGGHE